jgi:hypothetical protein
LAEIVNLRMARKRANRKAAETKAEQNRALSSVPGRQRRRSAAELEFEARRLDGARIDRPDKPRS